MVPSSLGYATSAAVPRAYHGLGPNIKQTLLGTTGFVTINPETLGQCFQLGSRVRLSPNTWWPRGMFC